MTVPIVLLLVALAWFGRRMIVRALLKACLRVVYRIRVAGLEHLPPGGALLVANHLSFVDALLVATALRRRVYFLMHRSFFETPVVGRFATMMDTIPVASEDTPEAKAASLASAAERAAAGDLVCIFAEGAISRSGALLPFARGLERIASEGRVPILPVALDRVWGSIFSFAGGRLFWKLPQRLPYPIDVGIGRPLAHDTPAWLVREHVQAEIAELREQRAPRTRSLAYRFLRAAGRNAGRTAVIDSTGVRLSYRALLRRTLVLRAVWERGLVAVEHVGVLLPPGAGAVLANVSLALAGRTVVNLNYTLGPADLCGVIERAGIRQVITSRRFLAALGRESPLPDEATILLEDVAGRTRAFDKLVALFHASLPGPLLARLLDPIDDGRTPVCVVFSSGTTGRPKGVVQSHANVASNVQSIAQLFAFGPDDRVLGVLPFFHSFGSTATLWLVLCSGASAVYHANPLDAQTIGELATRERPTILLATPTFFRGYLERCAPDAFASVRLCVSGAEKLGDALAAAWSDKFGRELHQGYGCTEMSPVVSINVPDTAGYGGRQSGSKRGTVGRALPGVAIRIVDPESLQSLPPEREGLLLVRGPNRMLGYLGEPERTAAALHEGWYVTGDLAVLDRDAFLAITDRVARFSKIGGEMVPHGRVEDALRSALERACPESPRAGEVDLVVTSLPDERRGERLVVLHTPLGCSLERWHAEALASGLPKLFLPRRSAYVEVAAIPYLGSGKIDLCAVRELARARAGGPG